MNNKTVWVAAFLIFTSPGSSLAAEGSMQEAKKYIEGAYTLEEWHAGEEIFRPPVVDGRLFFRDGVVATMLKNWSKADSKVSGGTYGRYWFDSSGFSYRYEDATIVTETPSEPKVSHKLLFDGTRSFTVTRVPDGIRLHRAEGNIEFVFTRDLLTYSENGKVLRVWRRIKSDKQS